MITLDLSSLKWSVISLLFKSFDIDLNIFSWISGKIALSGNLKFVVIGNENGVVGYGLGKAKEVQAAIQKGVDDAKKNLIKVPVLKGTIPHEQCGKYSGARVFLKPAAPGTGVIAGGAMRAVLESVGVKDVLAKCKGSSNPHSVVKATINALLQMKDPCMVAELRGVTLDKVFNG